MNPMLSRRSFLVATASAIPVAVMSQTNKGPLDSAGLTDVKALTFDVFGTVVDWRTSIIREGQILSKTKGIEADWSKFADAWRGGYSPAMNRVRKKEIPWANIDTLHRMILDELIPKFGLEKLSEDERAHLNRAWHRLMPWSDSVVGLMRLKAKFIIATLSNGNVSLLANMAKNAGLPWDCVLSAEMSGHYKPDPEVYQTAVRLLGLRTHEVMMVAAHRGDIVAAKKVGLKTAFVSRPMEYGSARSADTAPPESDVVAADFIELADKLRA